MQARTYSQKTKEVNRGWRYVDAGDQVLGRLATRVATILRGKDKPTFTPHIDGGDFVVVINAEKVRLTGRKLTDKIYYRYSGFRGGLKSRTAAQLLETKPEVVIREAVKGMLPKGALGRKLLTKLKIYAGTEHPHSAQNPVKVELN